ncbi:hypothetical protein CEXT_446121 [Caerostris extrusa]|uniref:Uncharacterized protein n=1 Tax=Caerostris extrusa TaxID=172846 RepID=A0AAV4X5U5_CAEEX|nr:hypothetical protein CEXT_446121 [Caerostris extrusa]
MRNVKTYAQSTLLECNYCDAVVRIDVLLKSLCCVIRLSMHGFIYYYICYGVRLVYVWYAIVRLKNDFPLKTIKNGPPDPGCCALSSNSWNSTIMFIICLIR